MQSRNILGVRVDATTYPQAAELILEWARRGRSRYVCLCAVNNIMEARRSPGYREVMRDAALVTSDGMPLVWMLRGLGLPHTTRIYGPDLTPMVIAAAAEAGIPVGFFGGGERVLARMVDKFREQFPKLLVAYAASPAFRSPTLEEDEQVTREINASGVRILFVGLGSPKQDRWMHAHQGRVNAVMLGVGAAFDFLAGAKPQAPGWMRRSGLEWLFRLCSEPRRLWRRYISQNPRFIALAVSQLIRNRFQ